MLDDTELLWPELQLLLHHLDDKSLCLYSSASVPSLQSHCPALEYTTISFSRLSICFKHMSRPLQSLMCPCHIPEISRDCQECDIHGQISL